MPQITLNIPTDNVQLLLEITAAMGLETEAILVKDSPAWHENILNERQAKYQSGKTKLVDWEDLDKEITESYPDEL